MYNTVKMEQNLEAFVYGKSSIKEARPVINDARNTAIMFSGVPTL
jgi:hypothetical protein